jgi:hypothetical protein
LPENSDKADSRAEQGPKPKEGGVPHFTEESLQRIIINPFYAISVARS